MCSRFMHMRKLNYLALALMILSLQWLSGTACSAQTTAKISSTQAIMDYLATMPGDAAGMGPELKLISDSTLARVFPGYEFYGLKYMRDSAGPGASSPLSRSNVFAVSNGNVKLIASKGPLQEFFGSQLASVQTDDMAKDAVYCWLRLAEELSYSGDYQFSIPVDAISVYRTAEEIRAAGKAVLNFSSGRAGQIGCTLTFDQTGALDKVQEASVVEPVATTPGGTH